MTALQSPGDGLAPAVIVHGPAHAQAALACARKVTLLSAAGAGVYGGVPWWLALSAPARALGMLAILDCGEQPGAALAALRLGVAGLVLRGPPAALADLQLRAAACGALLLSTPPPALDLGEARALPHLLAWLDGQPLPAAIAARDRMGGMD